MAGRQRVFVVTVDSDEAVLQRLRGDLGRDPLVVVAPTDEAARVARALGCPAETEELLAPVRFPAPDRGDRLDDLVRRHALRDRFRDLVVVTDPATATLLLRVLAPGQLATGGPVTVVGLVRGDRPVVVRRAVAAGVVLGVLTAVVESLLPVLALLGAGAALGVGLLLVPPVRHLGREVLLALAVAPGVALLVVAGASRFPAAW